MNTSPRCRSGPVALVILAGVVASVAVIAEASPQREFRPSGPEQAATATSAATDTPSPVPTPEEGECVGWGEKMASERAHLGGRIGITLTFQAACRGITHPLHVAFVLDGSETMTGSKSRDMQAGVTEVIEGLRLEQYPRTSVGIVSFNEQARTLCQLTNDEKRALSCVRQMRSEGLSAIHLGIEEGLRALVGGRSTDWGQGEINEVLVLVSDGQDMLGCSVVLRAAQQAKLQGVLVITVCVGKDCYDQCMRQAASSPHYFFTIENIGQLLKVFEQIRDELRLIDLRKVTVTDSLPANMSYVAYSAEPELKEISRDRRLLTWESNHVPRDGLTFTFEVEPQETGSHPTNLEAKALFRDNNKLHDFTYPVPYVDVGPRSTSTDTPTASPVRTAAPTVSPSPAPPSSVAYLPIAHRSDSP